MADFAYCCCRYLFAPNVCASCKANQHHCTDSRISDMRAVHNQVTSMASTPVIDDPRTQYIETAREADMDHERHIERSER